MFYQHLYFLRPPLGLFTVMKIYLVGQDIKTRDFNGALPVCVLQGFMIFVKVICKVIGQPIFLLY
jgi:hypothetical protein